MDARGWDERYSGRDLVWSSGPNRFVAEECAGLVPGRALDVACGEGRNALWLAELGWTVTGVDFSAVAIARARDLAEAKGVSVELLVEDVTAWEPPSGAFDLVVIAYLQLPDIGGVLARASEALAPGGVLMFVGHDRTNLTEGVGGPQDPAVLHTPSDVTAALPGLTVQRAERVRRPVEVDGEERFAVDTLVRAVRPPCN